jgi:hypothetical protein
VVGAGPIGLAAILTARLYSPSGTPPRWYDFIGQRRRYVSDLTWLGFGFVAGSCGVYQEGAGRVRWLALPIALIGLAMLGLALLRRLRSGR